MTGRLAAIKRDSEQTSRFFKQRARKLSMKDRYIPISHYGRRAENLSGGRMKAFYGSGEGFFSETVVANEPSASGPESSAEDDVVSEHSYYGQCCAEGVKMTQAYVGHCSNGGGL
jgi:hypothetical protein